MKAPDLLAAALEYHAHGWPVVPVGPDKAAWATYKHWFRRPQTEQVARGFPWDRLHGLAVLTWPASDLVALDFDGPHAEQVWQEQTGIALPETARNRTLSGGTHRIYTVPPGTPRPGTANVADPRRKVRLVVDPHCGCKKPCGVDLLLRGYFVVPPTPGYSEDPDHPFEPGRLATIPQAVLDLARKNDKRAPERHASDGRDADWFESVWAGVPEGQRNETAARMAGYYLHVNRGDQEATFRAMRLWASQCEPPFPEVDLRKVVKSIAGREASQGNGSDAAPVVVCLADVTPEAVSWLWPGRFPRGKLSLLIGDAGEGKSCVTIDVAACVSRGLLWPDGGTAPLGGVVLLTAEDGLADTVRPRLDAMEADSRRVVALRGVKLPGQVVPAPFRLAEDPIHLEKAIQDTGAILVVVDPVSAYLGKADSYKDADVRGLLAPLAALAERTGAAIVAVMHLTKDAQRKVLYRAQGSLGFVAAARAVFAVGEDPENPQRRLLLPVKNNLAPKPPGLAFRLIPTGSVVRVEWDAEPVTVDADAALAGPELPQERGEREEAKEFLVGLLTSGPVPSEDVKRQARAAGIAERTLFRAKHDLGIKADKDGFRGGWVWSLSPKAAKDATPAYTRNGGNVGNLRGPEAPAEVDL